MENHSINTHILNRMLDDLAVKGWAAAPDVFPLKLCEALVQECHGLQTSGALNKASIGGTQNKTMNQHIRGDYTFWLDHHNNSAPQSQFLQELTFIATQLNQAFYLGIQRSEAHFALYPPEAHYAKHIDTPQGSSARKITFVLYLNSPWQPGDGGELSLFEPQNPDQLITRISPQLGTFVLFRSEMFPHQVEVCSTSRRSLTGWFRNDFEGL